MFPSHCFPKGLQDLSDSGIQKNMFLRYWLESSAMKHRVVAGDVSSPKGHTLKSCFQKQGGDCLLFSLKSGSTMSMVLHVFQDPEILFLYVETQLWLPFLLGCSKGHLSKKFATITSLLSLSVFRIALAC